MDGLLTASEAGSIGLAFITGKYYRGEITLSQTELNTEGAFPVYFLQGNIKVPTRSILGRLIARDAPYTFTMQVHALEGSILDYVVR